MTFDDFFVKVLDPFDSTGSRQVRTAQVDMDAVRRFASTPMVQKDLSGVIAFVQVVRGQFNDFGTEGGESLTGVESREVLRLLRSVLRQCGVTLDPPWSDFQTFRTYWIAHEGRGSWQDRRDMLADVFEPVLDELENLHDRVESNHLSIPVSPHASLGWSGVDDQIVQLRERFATARTPIDYKDVGNRCVGVLEALSAEVYNPSQHCPPGATVPPIDRTDVRIGAYIDEKLPGRANAQLRGLVKKCSQLAHKMKHSPRADRTVTGIAADSVILLANILRRLEEDNNGSLSLH